MRQREGIGRKLDVKSSKSVQEGTFSMKFVEKWTVDIEVEPSVPGGMIISMKLRGWRKEKDEGKIRYREGKREEDR